MTLNEFFTAVQAVLPARRGNIYEQYLEREGTDGKKRRFGPYYVWTRCEGGKMLSSRVPRKDVPRVREEISRGKHLNGLMGQLWKLAEDMARNAGDAKKKNSNRSTGRRPPLSPSR